MEYVPFGPAGIKVSRIALGLGFRGQPDETEAQKVIEAALDRGINLIDCANVYGPMDDRANIGRSEVVLGRALVGRRDDVVITSKVASPIGPGPNDRGLSRHHMMREIDRSLTRLGTDHLDVYLAHAFVDDTALEETLGAFDDLVRAGKTRYYGLCNFSAWQFTRAHYMAAAAGKALPVTAQNPYSLMNRSLETELFPMCRAIGAGIMAYSPLAVGLLSGAYGENAPPPDGSLWATRRQGQLTSALSGSRAGALRAVREIADEHGATPAQVALAWVISHPEITVAITGGDTIDHLDDNIGALDLQLSDVQLRRLNEVSADLTDTLD
jgi:1-deoxyxylulose-5-phosphate synthase